jgi:hypothetical protein
MKTKSEGMLDLVDGEVFLDGKPIHGSLGQRFIEFINAQIEITPLINFCRKLRKNPSVSSIDQLFGFLDANKHPITKDGNFIAYKKIRNDYKDFHSGTFDNSPGKVLEMPRDLVNEDPTQTCSTGLHVANWSYAFFILFKCASAVSLVDEATTILTTVLKPGLLTFDSIASSSFGSAEYFAVSGFASSFLTCDT